MFLKILDQISNFSCPYLQPVACKRGVVNTHLKQDLIKTTFPNLQYLKVLYPSGKMLCTPLHCNYNHNHSYLYSLNMSGYEFASFLHIIIHSLATFTSIIFSCLFFIKAPALTFTDNLQYCVLHLSVLFPWDRKETSHICAINWYNYSNLFKPFVISFGDPTNWILKQMH